MSTFLLDANVLIALTIAEHEHHARAERWLATGLDAADRFALCPIVEGALLRFVLRLGESATVAHALLVGVCHHPRCDFWPDELNWADLDVRDLRGHRQVTDSYLAALAASRGGRLATLDKSLAALRPHDTMLIPAP